MSKVSRLQSRRGPDLIAAPLLTSPSGSEVQLVTRDGLRHRLALEAPVADLLAISLWRGIEAKRGHRARPAARRPRAG
jgi:hypothetical protein